MVQNFVHSLTALKGSNVINDQHGSPLEYRISMEPSFSWMSWQLYSNFNPVSPIIYENPQKRRPARMYRGIHIVPDPQMV